MYWMNIKNNYLNFYDYMKLRLFIFSWKKCSVLAQTIDESNFGCAIQVSSGYKTLPINEVRRMFQLGLELSNAEYVRNLDFVSFLYVANSMRLYGKINGKEDQDISKHEFNLALDNNILPSRFNQKIVDQIFTIIAPKNKDVNGLDPITFIFLDYSLRLFNVKNATRPYYVNQTEFLNILANPLFPNKTLSQIYKLPSFSMTNESFKMFASMNVSVEFAESDFLLKFLELKSKKLSGKKLNERSRLSLNSKIEAHFKNLEEVLNMTSFNITKVGRMLFRLLDINDDGYVTFDDFGHMMQIIYIFNKEDIYCKGYLSVGKLSEHFRYYSNYPRISHENSLRILRIDSMNQDLNLNVFQLIVVLSIDDIAEFYIRVSDKSTVYEVDLKKLLIKIGLRNMPDLYLTNCLRGNDNNGIPKYDWECAINSGLTLMSQYYDAAYFYLASKHNKFTLGQTVIHNIDPQLLDK